MCNFSRHAPTVREQGNSEDEIINNFEEFPDESIAPAHGTGELFVLRDSESNLHASLRVCRQLKGKTIEAPKYCT